MQLSTKQIRLYTLATLLGAGKPVASDAILAALRCSDATMTRTFKALRETWSAEIRYRKASHTYEMTDAGSLDKKTLRRLEKELASQTTEPAHYRGKVSLDKEKKQAVSLSMSGSVIRKINHLTLLTGKTRSDAVEMLVTLHIDEFIDTILRRNAADTADEQK